MVIIKDSDLRREPANKEEMGARQYNERISRESKFAEDSKNLPYKFSKPRKEKLLRVYFRCDFCGHESAITDETILVICGSCKKLNRIKNFTKKGFTYDDTENNEEQ